MSIRYGKSFEPIPESQQLVTLVVKDETGRRLVHTMRRTAVLKNLMDFYYSIMAPAVEHGGAGVFEYGGRQIVFPRQKTPADYEMKDGDVISFFPAVRPEEFVTPVLQENHGGWRRFACTMRRTDRMQGLMDFYCKCNGVPAAALAFEFYLDGRSLGGDETPEDLHLEEGAQINVQKR